MGFMDRLMGKSDGKIQVYVEPDKAGPGDEIVVSLNILEPLDGKARSVLAGITSSGQYKVEERRQNEQGYMDTNVVWRSVELHGEQQTLELRNGEQSARFKVPEQAQPSSAEIVTWKAWARVDRQKGIDVVQNQSFDVSIPVDRVPSRRETDPTDDGLTLVGVPAVASQGESLRGTLVVDVLESVKVREVSVRLHRRVSHVADALITYSGEADASGALFGGVSRIIDDTVMSQVELAGKISFEPGQRQEFPFEIHVPANGATSAHVHAQVDWRIEAVLDRRMRGDKTVEATVTVV